MGGDPPQGPKKVARRLGPIESLAARRQRSVQPMDLTAAAIHFQQAKVAAGVQTRVARQVLDMQEFQGAAVVRLIDAAAGVTAQAGDALVAAAIGLGREIDTYG